MKTTLKWVLGIIIVLGVFFALCSIKNVQGLTKDQPSMGIIRPDANGTWYIEDVNHTDICLSSVTTYDTYIKVNFCESYLKITSMAITGDEKFADWGYLVGASTSFGYSKIYIYDADGGLINPHNITNSSTNINVAVWGEK